MTFNQWAALAKIDDTSRSSFKAVWDAMTGGGCSPGEASSLLIDLIESLPETEGDDDWEGD
jgi:hypothetical protein